MKTRTLAPLVLLGLLLCLAPARAPLAQAPQAPILLGECLVLPPVGQGGRALFYRDALDARLVRGDFRPPVAGETVPDTKGEPKAWAAATAEGGVLEREGLAGSYVHWSVAAEGDEVRVLEAQGHSGVFINGSLRQGDVYFTGTVRTPVSLKKGDNQFLFRCARERLEARLTMPPAAVFLNTADTTLPDVYEGGPAEYLGSVVVVNTTSRFVRPIISASTSSGTLHEASGTVPPLGWRKLAFRFLPAPGPECAVRLRLRLDDALMHEQTVLAAVKGRHDIRKVTFTSSIDGSVQYYGLNPARRDDGPAAPALVLSLHGASVEAIGQAHAYGRKDWCHVVCPTNRRPYGFDWEDWGRQDALEVLAHAQASLRHDPSRVYLTGHSMGGHGTWTVGAHFPDRFAAIAPSAGWQSFWTYSGGGIAVPEGDAVGAVLRRASNPSDTLLMKDNYRRQAVYILHGDADETVPVTEARAMRDALAPFHKDMQCFEHPGGAHWWDNDSEPGAACVDWPGFFDLFAARRLPAAAEIREFSFTTVCPGNSATCYWVTIVQQQRPLLPSRVDLRCDPQSRLVRGLTDNARRVALDLSHLEPGNPVTIALDDAGPGELPWPKNGVFNLLRTEAGWQESALPAAEKNPARGGGFKNAMRNRFVLVYGTGGNETEQRAAFDKARLDAEQFGYRGNGSVEVMPDTEFDPALEPGRCVVLYGNADTNRHWQTLLAGSPVTVSRGKVTVGSVSMDGDHYGLLLARPHPLHSGSMVAAVGATGADGMRATLRLPYFLAGTGVPDFVVLTADLPSKGLEGVQAAGFFGNDWSYVASESAWR